MSYGRPRTLGPGREASDGRPRMDNTSGWRARPDKDWMDGTSGWRARLDKDWMEGTALTTRYYKYNHTLDG
nr:hypothetical protein [Tanacetum cinerariifolium]